MNALLERPDSEGLPAPDLAPFAPPSGYSGAARPVPARTPPKSDGPELPPLTPGLRNTEACALRALWCFVLVAGLRDALNGIEPQWVGSDDWYLICEWCGIEERDAERVSDLFWSGSLGRQAVSYALCGLAGSTPRVTTA